MLVLVCRCGWWVCSCGEIVEPLLYSPRVVPVCGKAVAWAPHGGAGCAGFVSCEPACVSDVLAPCGSVGAPQPGGVLGLAGGGVGSAGGAEHGGHAHTDIEGQAERAPGQQDHGPGEERQPELLLPAQRLPRRPQRIKKPRQPQPSNAKSFQGLAAVAVNVSRNINQARCAVQQVVLISKI